MPTGTGKTITLLSLITSYQLAHPDVGKLVYCTRTVPEMEKVLAELRELVAYRERYFSEQAAAAGAAAGGGGGGENGGGNGPNGAAAGRSPGGGGRRQPGAREEEGDGGGANVPSAAALAAAATERAAEARLQQQQQQGQQGAWAAAGGLPLGAGSLLPPAPPPPILALGLSSRKNLCVHPTVAEEGSRESVDAGCRRLTASWVRARAGQQNAGAGGGGGAGAGAGAGVSGAAAARPNPPNAPSSSSASVPTCAFYEALDAAGPDALLPPGVYTLHDLRAEGRRRGWCPYYLARRLVGAANVVVYSYQYLVDPKVAQAVSRELERECVVVFDEAHNIDNVCIEALSVSLRERALRAAARGCARLDGAVAAARRAGRERLDAEYRRLVQGLVDAGQLPGGGAGGGGGGAAGGDGGGTAGGAGGGGALARARGGGGDDWLATPVLPDDVARDAVPGNLRRAEHFVAFMRRLVAHLQQRLRPREVTVEGPARFLAGVARACLVEPASLRHCHDRLSSLLSTLEVTDTDEYLPLQLVADFATLLGTYPTGGFAVVMEPCDERLPHIPDPVLQLACLDAALAMRPVFSRFRSVVVTSGTLSPIDLYPRILGFRPVVCQSLGMTMTRAAACPVVVGRASDSVVLSSRYEGRYDDAVVRGYGRLLVELAGVVPDGMVSGVISCRVIGLKGETRHNNRQKKPTKRPRQKHTPKTPTKTTTKTKNQTKKQKNKKTKKTIQVVFFVSYSYMDHVVARWHEWGVLRELMARKLVFVETQDVLETTLALDAYRRACDAGRGAAFFSIARGKVAEGIDFDRHYGRCVVVIGVPYQYTLSRTLRCRLDFLRDAHEIKEADFLAFDAVRQAAQCLGRVIRSKSDYGLMVLADARYARADKRAKLPKWVAQALRDAHVGLPTDACLVVARRFMRAMAQPVSPEEAAAGLLSAESVAALADEHRRAAAAAAAAAMMGAGGSGEQQVGGGGMAMAAGGAGVANYGAGGGAAAAPEFGGAAPMVVG